jgi:hypothetical protein
MSSNDLLLAAALSALLAAGCGNPAPPAPPAAASAAPVAVASAAASTGAPDPSASGSAPAPAASGSAPAASGSGPAASASAAPKKPPPPAIADNPPPEEKTPAPSKADWATAPEVSLARHSMSSCTAKVLHEWVQIACGSFASAGFSMIAGERAGVAYRALTDGPETGSWLVFPARRGDQRLIQLHSWAKWGWVPSLMVSEQWLTGDKGPLITVMDI